MLAQAYQTPEANRARSSASWVADLDAYIASHEGTPGGSRDTRQRLVSSVKANPQSAEAWRALLAFEEAHGGNVTHGLQAAADPGKVSLYHIYYWATQLVPRSSKTQHKEAYLKLWLGFARQQWSRSPDDARDTFKTLKNQHIGDASAHLYHEWASLEHAAGNVSKALGVLAKGIRAEAQPASLLEQLRAEMQSGTFDLKHAGAYTETLTIDASCAAARHVQQMESTPAPGAAAEPKTAAGFSVAVHSSRPGLAAPAGIASCLKSSSTAAGGGAAVSVLGHSTIPEHGSRAVTFAADVHDTDGAHEDFARRAASSSAGPASTCSARSFGRSADGHSGCLSTSSTSSRSTASVHDGAFMPFSTGATASYKSSTTESSSMEGVEEDTISCRVAGTTAGTASREPTGVKPSTAPLNGSSSTPGAGLGSNTATIGLKRFGFKSRALRVGGTSDVPAAQAEPATASRAVTAQDHSSSAMPPPAAPAAAAASASATRGVAAAAAPVVAGAAAAPVVAGAAAGVDDELAAGRKRRAGHGSTPSPKTSPKLAATYKDGQQCKAPADKAAGGGSRGSQVAGGCRTAAAGSSGVQLQTTTAAGGIPSCPAAADEDTSGDDSVPLVSSKLAARLAQDRGTPAPTKGKDSAGWQGVGSWTPPAEGQLPSSLETTPEVVCGTSSAAFTGTGSCRTTELETWNGQQAQPGPSSQHQQTAASRRSVYAADSKSAAAVAAAAGAADGSPEQDDDSPPPTMVLTDTGPGMRPTPAVDADASAAPGAPRHLLPAHTASAAVSAAAAAPAPAAAREPLRPIQPQPQASSAQHAASEPPGQAHLSSTKQSARTAPAVPPAVSEPQQQSQQHQQHQQAHAERHHSRAQPQQQHHHQQEQQQQHVVRQQQKQPGPQQEVVRQSRPREDAQTVYVQGVRYNKLECVGRGGSSKVFKVLDTSCKIYALKRIRLAGRDAEAASGFIDEINLLMRLRNKPNIIQLIDSQVFQAEGLIYMVQEYGEIDLARLLAKHDATRRAAAGANAPQGGLLKDNLDENFIRLYWQQMLQAVSGVHEQRIVHSDLKPANFLMVEGQLKLIDFGIAKAISGDTTSIARESQVGTLNYMSPEAILGGSNNILGGPAMRVGRPSDVWSLGCILYQMVYGRTPFAELPFLPKMHAICNPQHQVAYPPLENKDLMDVMRRCLDRDPKTRITLQELLDHPFLHPNRRQPAPAPPPTGVGLSEEQMKQLVAQVAAAGAAGVTDIDKLTKDLMQKLGATSLSDQDNSSTPGSNCQPANDEDRQMQQAHSLAPQQQAAVAASDSNRSRSRIPSAPSAASTAAPVAHGAASAYPHRQRQ